MPAACDQNVVLIPADFNPLMTESVASTDPSSTKTASISLSDNPFATFSSLSQSKGQSGFFVKAKNDNCQFFRHFSTKNGLSFYLKMNYTILFDNKNNKDQSP